MLDILKFADNTFQMAVLNEGDRILEEAEKQPPTYETAAFNRVVAIVVLWMDQKSVRQDRVLSFLTKLPQFAVTEVTNKMKIKVGQTPKDSSRALTIERLQPAVEAILRYAQATVFSGEKSQEIPSSVQVGAVHNLLSCFEVLEKGNLVKIYNAGAIISDALEIRFGTIPDSYRRRLDVLNKQLEMAAERKTQEQKPPVVPVTKPAMVQSRSDFAAKLSQAVIVEESAAEQSQLMEQTMKQLDGLNPEAIELAKNGLPHPPTSSVLTATNIH